MFLSKYVLGNCCQAQNTLDWVRCPSGLPELSFRSGESPGQADKQASNVKLGHHQYSQNTVSVSVSWKRTGNKEKVVIEWLCILTLIIIKKHLRKWTKAPGCGMIKFLSKVWPGFYLIWHKYYFTNQSRSIIFSLTIFNCVDTNVKSI